MEALMKVRWLGWAGVEIEAEGERVVVDPLADAGAVFGWLRERAAGLPRPEVVAPRGGALAGLVTHLHRDHTDAAALAAALSPGGPVYEPEGYGPPRAQDVGLAQADHELTAAGLERRRLAPWTSTTVGPFTITALPAVDGTGDPQVSWLIEAGGRRVLHLGDTMFHAWWWRFTERFGAPTAVLAPINGARVTFPHLRPSSPVAAVMDPGEAALAAELLKAERLVPIHYDGYAVPGLYEPVPDALGQLTSRSDRVSVLGLGQELEI
jgi:L-ascorbate metabolism protein UlaG (beta-lactamase superfamily)